MLLGRFNIFHGRFRAIGLRLAGHADEEAAETQRHTPTIIAVTLPGAC